MKKLLLLFLKIGIPVAIIAYLVADAKSDQAFSDLRDHPKHWGLLAAAWACCSTAVMLTLIRWYYLVRALDLSCRFRDALRIGFLGYMFNLAPMGIVGGDLLKAVMLGREQNGGRAKAFASVIVDRVIGLYMLFVVASAAILLTGFQDHARADIRALCMVTWWLAGIGSIAIVVLLFSGASDGKIARLLGSVPYVGSAVERLIGAMRMYRKRPRVLAAAFVMTIGVHGMFSLGIFLLATGIYQEVLSSKLSLDTHFVIAPLSAAAGVIPLSMGPFETILSFLYAVVSGVSSAKAQGLVVALAYRIVTVLIAMVGVGYYLSARREVAEVMHEAEEEPPGEQPPTVVAAAAGIPQPFSGRCAPASQKQCFLPRNTNGTASAKQ